MNMTDLLVNSIVNKPTKKEESTFVLFILKHPNSKAFIITKKDTSSNTIKLSSVILNQIVNTKPRQNSSSDRTAIIEYIVKHDIRREASDWTHEYVAIPEGIKTGDFIRQCTEKLLADGWFNLKSPSSIKHDFKRK